MTAQPEADEIESDRLDRAALLIRDGRLRILAVRGDTSVLAHVGGSHGETYQVIRKADGRVMCACDAARWNLPDCVHRAALRLVVG